MPTGKPLANQDLLRRVRDYLPMDAAVRKLDARGHPDSPAATDDLVDNTFYGFNSDTMVAFSHAIEDLALDEANGSLLSSFQEARNFESQRERYWQLAATIDAVQVLVGGRRPRRHGRLQFVSMDGSALLRFWVVLHQGRRAQALVLSRQINDTEIIEEKQFAGFYSLDPRLIGRVRQDIQMALADHRRGLCEFERLWTIDRVGSHLRRALAQETAALETTLGRWQSGAGHFQEQDFLQELDRGVRRLQDFRERLQQWLGDPAHSSPP